MQGRFFYHALKVNRDICHGCTHCLLECPTHAIRIKNGKALVNPDLCVDCGRCLEVCPVGAIEIEQDDFDKIFDYKYRVALVPSVLIGQFSLDVWEQQIFSVLMDMGFTHVFEAEEGIDILLHIFPRLVDPDTPRPVISSYCPAVMRLIQVRFPSFVNHINRFKAPLSIVSAFYRQVLIGSGAKDEEIGIFYVTPCAAKIAAVKTPGGERQIGITGVINMNFIYNKICQALVKQKTARECSLPTINPISKTALLWSLPGGENRLIKGRALSIDGIHHVIEFMEKLENDEIGDIDYLEFRACDQGCAGGALNIGNRFLNVERLYKRAEACGASMTDSAEASSAGRPRDGRSANIERYAESLRSISTTASVSPQPMEGIDGDMGEAIRKMEMAQKIFETLPQTDCGLCGSPGCRLLAEDVAKGDANILQCVFMMKRKLLAEADSSERRDELMRYIWGERKFTDS